MNNKLSYSPFILTQLEVFNWGPFNGRHCAQIDPEGSAIIGPTGSGKTTLVDALMTLLVARPKYNLASTGGHESDRDLISYIRGVTGAGNNIDNDHVIRQGKTTTGISARFSNGSEMVQIGVVLWIDGISFAAKDQKDLWLFTEKGGQSLEQWLLLHQDGGARALKQYGRETEGLRIFDTRKSYLAQLRQRFEVGENAFALLNRAAGLKQLNSIDEIFRELVLEDRSAFERAAEVSTEFDDLTAIHNELEIARRQQQSLIPVAKTYDKYRDRESRLKRHNTLLQIVPLWFAMAGHRAWGALAKEIKHKLDEINTEITAQEQQESKLRSKADALKDIYLKAGGAGIEQLKEQIGTQKELLAERRTNANQYQALARNLGLDDTLTHAALLKNQQQAASIEIQIRETLQQDEAKLLEISGTLVERQHKEKQYREEIEKIENRPGSNIDGKYQDFRAELATELGIAEESLPFIAQLVEVKPEQRHWQGAIERAIGNHRLRILVPPEQMQAALHWVNSRDNRLHVRLLEAKMPQQPAQFTNDGFTHKLNYKQHPFRETVKTLLAGIDRHCVDSPEILRHTPHGMTVQGLMSGKSGFFEKQDQRPLDWGWMTGFDNKHRLMTLSGELAQLTRDRKQWQKNHETAKQAVKQSENKLQLINRLIGLNFDTIDSPGAAARLEDLQQRLALLNDPDSDVAKARLAFEQAEQALKTIVVSVQSLRDQRARLETKFETANNNREKAFRRIGDGLNDEQLELAEANLPLLNDDIDLDQLDVNERNEHQRLERERDSFRGQFEDLGKKLVRSMGEAQKVDTGALSEVGTDIDDVPAYLERLKTLTEEALPDKLNRFLDYLNQSSDQGVTQLLTDIENEVSQIEERIHELNLTLQRVDFQPGQYLQLIPQRVVHESITTLHKAQRYLRSATLKDDKGESHYSALKNVIDLLRDASERKNTVGAKALLDPRYRLQFAASVLDRHSQKQISEFKGSQSGSGGEKEIIASYILTASLSYALCPPGMTRPLFGTIVLDEAFSKSSQAVAGRIILALREFGLHPLFITPNKEMRLLRNHTRSAILVHRKGLKATLTSMSWEELEHVASQKVHQHEVA